MKVLKEKKNFWWPIVNQWRSNNILTSIFLVIVIGGLLIGITGMIFAVPLYTVIKVILKEFLSDNPIVKSLTKGFD